MRDPRRRVVPRHQGDLTHYRCAKCGVRTMALLWNVKRQRWFCHACFQGPRRSERTVYWAEEYDAPIGSRKPRQNPVKVAGPAPRPRRVA